MICTFSHNGKLYIFYLQGIGSLNTCCIFVSVNYNNYNCMKSNYHERKATRLERAEELAAKNSREAESRRKLADKQSERFYMGQPILVGHHSEASARATQEKMHNNMSKSIELDKKAEYYANMAASITTSTAISSDDPDALEKLRIKLEKLEAQGEQYRTTNEAYRAFKKKGLQALDGFELVGPLKKLVTTWMPQYASDKAPIPPYMMSNLNGQMKQVKDRIARLEKMESLVDSEEVVNGAVIKSMPSENRVMIVFDGKPAQEVIDNLKTRGFRWAPSQSAWMRQYSTYALYEARTICEGL